MTSFFHNLGFFFVFFFLLTSILKKNLIFYLKWLILGDTDRLLEHSDADDDEDEGNTSTPFQPDYDSTRIEQETINFHK